MPTNERYDAKGALIESRSTPTLPEDLNRDDLTSRAALALTTNAAFLAIAAPSNAQNATQIKALTRQVNALIRLVVGRLEETAGT